MEEQIGRLMSKIRSLQSDSAYLRRDIAGMRITHEYVLKKMEAETKEQVVETIGTGASLLN